jgi:hypothetical protein
MIRWLTFGLHLAAAGLKCRRSLVLENLALRHQLLVLSRSVKRPRLEPLDRALWVWLSHSWKGWKSSLRIFQPDSVIQWHGAGFRLFWRWKSRPRPTADSDESGHLFQSISDTVPILSDSCRSEATL